MYVTQLPLLIIATANHVMKIWLYFVNDLADKDAGLTWEQQNAEIKPRTSQLLLQMMVNTFAPNHYCKVNNG